MITEAEELLKAKNSDKAKAAVDAIALQSDLAVADRAGLFSLYAEFLLGQTVPETADAKIYLDRILEIKDLSADAKLGIFRNLAGRRFKSNFPSYSAGGIVYHENGILGALTVYRMALEKIEGLSNDARIELYKSIADCYFELMDVDSANAELEK